MKSIYVLPLAVPEASLAIVGGKGASLARMAEAGLPVPDGYHVTTRAYQEFIKVNNLEDAIFASLGGIDLAKPSTLERASEKIQALLLGAPVPQEIVEAVARAYEGLPGDVPRVAVRSSATAEDLPELSFAGQQETYLNIQGVDQVEDAVKRCWASLWTGRAIGYRLRQGIDSRDLGLAVVVQVMVPAEASGVLFTANPINGQRDQALINDAWGLGEAIVGGQVTPDTLTVDKVTGFVLQRETADKQSMTIGELNGTHIQAVPDEMRQKPVLDDQQAAELVALGNRVEELYGNPTDIEWAMSDGRFYIVQARPITALPEGLLPIPVEWPLPDPEGRYMRTSIIDLMPDPLRPLFASLGLAHLNAGILALLREMTGSKALSFKEETMVTINDYAYMDVNYTAGQWWWMLTRLLPRFPWLLRHGLRFWRDDKRPKYLRTIERWEKEPLAGMPLEDLVTGIHAVIDSVVEHIGSLMVGTMGVSAGSEGLFTSLYDRMVKREGDPPAPTFLMGYNSIPIQAEKSLFDLASTAGESHTLAEHLLHTASEELVTELQSDLVPNGVEREAWHTWEKLFMAHLERFGHIIYNLDFTEELPLDHPELMLETIKMYLRGAGTNPHERQASLAEKREQATQQLMDRGRGLRLSAVRKALAWAQKQAEVREDGIADIGLGYPLLRRMLLELGNRFTQAGLLGTPEDIFWLYLKEIEAGAAALQGEGALESISERIPERKAVWEAEKRAVPPPMLPPSDKYMGFKVDAFMAVGDTSQAGRTIKGLGASPGKAIAPARVLHGPEDFDEMQAGDALVASITTPAWTPLFAMAAAIVTDIGGPLSHGSIVAREYGIPAVLGTGVATRRIQDGQIITVDGDSGLVVLND